MNKFSYIAGLEDKQISIEIKINNEQFAKKAWEFYEADGVTRSRAMSVQIRCLQPIDILAINEYCEAIY